MMNTHKIIKIGNCSTGKSEGGVVLSPEGIFSTVTAGTHGYGFSNIIEITNKVTSIITKECNKNAISGENNMSYLKEKLDKYD